MAPSSRPGERREGWIERERKRERKEGKRWKGEAGGKGEREDWGREGREEEGGGKTNYLKLFMVSPRSST